MEMEEEMLPFDSLSALSSPKIEKSHNNDSVSPTPDPDPPNVVVKTKDTIDSIFVMDDTPKRRGDYDSDEEPPNDDSQENRLNWRLNRSISLSDWTITIVSQTIGGADGKTRTTITDIYHVHKTVLAFGPRKSEYFFNRFHQETENNNKNSDDDCCESSYNNSRIELPELAAKSFPKVLDYLYSTNGQLDIDTSTSSALYYLGRYFRIRSLRWQAKMFWQNDLTIDNAATYFQHGRIFKDTKIIRAVCQLCADKLLSITPDSRIVHVSDTQLWLDILEMGATRTNLNESEVLSDDTLDYYRCFDFSSHMSKLIAEYCSTRKNDIDSGTFHALVDGKYLPQIHFDAASRLITLEQQIVGTGDVCCADELSCLQDRCIRSLAVGWDSIDVDQPEMVHFLSTQPPLVLANLLSSILSSARDENWQLKKEVENNANIAESWKKRHSHVTSEKERLRQELDQAKANSNLGSRILRRATNRQQVKKERDGENDAVRKKPFSMSGSRPRTSSRPRSSSRSRGMMTSMIG